MVANTQPSWSDFLTPSTYIPEKERLFTIPKEEIQEQLPEEFSQGNVEESIEKPEPKWSDFQTPGNYQAPVDPIQDESTFEWLGRNIASNVVRGLEAIGGRYGNIYEFLQAAALKMPETTGLLGWGLEKIMGKEAWQNMVLGQPGMLGIKPPTTTELHGLTKGLTGEYLEPKTFGEKKFQEVFTDIASVASRRPAGQSLPQYSANNLGIPLAANFAQETAKELGFDEEKGMEVKGLTWLTLGLLNNVNAPRWLAQRSNDIRQRMPNNAPINVNRYETNLNRSARNFLPGDEAAAAALQQYNTINTQIQNGQTNLGDLMTRYDAINRAKNSRGMFDLNRADRRLARRNIDQILHNTRDEIQAVTGNSPVYNEWREMMQSYAVVHQSQRLSQWADNLMTGRYARLAQGTTLGLFGAGVYKLPAYWSSGASTIAPAAYKLGQVGYRVWEDPQLARYYWQTLNAQARRDGPAFLLNAQKLEDSYQKKEKKKK